MNHADTITHILSGDWKNEMPPVSSLGFTGYATEILWVGQGKKLIAFSHTFFLSDEVDSCTIHEMIGLGEALGLTWKEEGFIHKATANNTKYPQGTELEGVEITWHRKDDPQSVQALELYEHIREQFTSKEIKWSSGLFHILLGILACYSVEEIKAHNLRICGEYSQEDKARIQEYHPAFKVFL